MSNIKFFVMDVDGTLTDGKIYMGTDGELMKAFDVKDGYGIHNILPEKHIIPIIITGRTSKILENRCKEIGIEMIFQGIDNKNKKLQEILRELGGSYNEVAYIGDDINDLSCMRAIKENGGLIGCPSDAVDEVKQLSSFISNKVGGAGAVRQFIDSLF